MNTVWRMSYLIRVAVLALPIVLGGCIFPHWSHTGNDIQSQQVKRIEPGKTTKQELFALLGAPMGIAVQKEAMVLLAPTKVRSGPRILPRGTYEVQADTLFELFSVRHTFTEYDRIYYYYDATSSKIVYFFLLFIYESGGDDIDRLWVLMNEKTDIVEDYVYRQHP